MASGIAVHDDVVLTFDKIRVRLQGADKQEQLKLVLFKISDDGKCIIVDEENCLKVKHLENEDDIFKKIVSVMPKEDCRYALYDCSWESKDSPKEDLVFIMWAPENSSIKKKMKYASSKQYIKAKFQGLKFEWQVNDMSDARDNSVFIEKLGGRGVVRKLEGKEV
ncbi:non-muscle cofilin 1-like isoform X1 [Esox lucius]|uniref:ADF-H domain-containing protein n=1 Tax=Esox lucius TaxID=8010 RepID=A0A6Q2XI67_ESOLU|nr:non-muscle cofilin 1-like isoform X1 [Esox lucius]